MCSCQGDMSIISEDAARCWARTFAKIARCAARCAARWARPSWFKDSELRGGRSDETSDPVLKVDKMDSLPAGSWGKILCNSQASWVIVTGGFGWRHIRGFSPIIRIVVMIWTWIFRHTKTAVPVVGQLGCLVPAVHLISMSISRVTHDSIEEVFQGSAAGMAWRIDFFRQVCRCIAIFIDLEGVSMDDSLAPLRRLERGEGLEIWSGGAGVKRHRDWCRMTGISGGWFRVSQACNHPKALVRLISNYCFLVISVLKVFFYLLGYFISWLLGCLSFCPNRLFIWIKKIL